MMRSLFFLWITCLFTVTAAPVQGHVPYIEQNNISEDNPFHIKDCVENAKAVYAWFKTGEEINPYVFEVDDPVRVRIYSLVPVCKGYETFLPWFAVLGPGLPVIEQELPFTVPQGYGGYVVENFQPGEKRDRFFEFVTRKSYYKSPEFDMTVSAKGKWYVYFWDPYKQGGDYVAVFGIREPFTLSAIVRTIRYAPVIMLNRELHIDCEAPEE